MKAETGSGRCGGPEPTLLAISRELASARDMALDVQDATSALIEGASAGGATGAGGIGAGATMAGPSRDALFRLQNLDRLTQTLDELSDFLAELAEAAPPGWEIDTASATRALRMRDLASRLAAGGGGEPACAPPTSLDDFLL